MASLSRPRTLTSLPEDILHEILAICLTPTEFLTDYRPTAYRRAPDQRHAYLLLVCKPWYRIGMPLLYKYLRTKTQSHTKTIHQVLAANPRLGMAVRNFRIEGGMGRELRQVASFLPNVKHLYISSSTTKAVDSVAGLRRVLPMMSVEHLYFQKGRWRSSNKPEREVESIVTKALALPWESITSVTFPDSCYGPSPLSDDMVNALQKLPRLEELAFVSSDLERMARNGKFDFLKKFPSLARIRCLGSLHTDSIREEFERHHVPKELSDKVVFVRTRRDEEIETWVLHEDSDSEESLFDFPWG